MGPVTTALAVQYGVPVSFFLIHVIAGFFKDRKHAETVQAVAIASATAAANAVAAGATPKQIGQAAGAAAIGAAVTALPAAPAPTAGG